MVLVEAHGGGCTGVGYTYGDAATGVLVRNTLASLVEGHDAFDVRATTERLRRACRNLGRPGIGAMAIAAIDYRPLGSQGALVRRSARYPARLPCTTECRCTAAAGSLR